MSSLARCSLPRPRRRRVSAMPISSMARRAFTLPTPGRASKAASTLVFPTTSSPSDWSRSSREGQGPHLQPFLEFGTGLAGRGGLLEGGCPLLRRQLGR